MPERPPGQLARLGNPLNLPRVDRALIAGSFVLGATLLFVALVRFLEGWPYFPPDVDPAAMDLIARLAGFAVVGPWVGFVLLGLALRRRAPDSRAYVHLMIQLYALTIAAFTYLTGPFSSPGWIAFVGGTVVGFFLFDRLSTLLGAITFYVGMGAIAGAVEYELLPYAPLIHGALRPGISGWWSVRLGISSVVFSTLTIGLASYIISRWRDREARFEELSRTDALTGLANRRWFMEAFGSELEKARRYATPLSCLMIDLDHFKRVNDRYGHLVGDQVLVTAAGAIKSSLRGSDLVSRYGGEEFAILLPNTEQKGAEEVAERCRRLIRDTPVLTAQGPLTVTASMGLASFPRDGVARVDDLIRLADGALYRAKEEGRDRVLIAV